MLRHLKTVRDLGYFSGNECVTSYFEGWLNHAEAVRPKQAGTNGLIHHTSCAFIYSNKAQTDDEPIRVALGFTADEIKRARETEDVIQFVMRGAVRDPTFTGTYTVYLYDRVQADALDDYLRANGVTDDVRIEGVEEAGILDAQRPASRSGRSPRLKPRAAALPSREQARLDADAERKRSKRARREAVKEANGTLRKRGRPEERPQLKRGAGNALAYSKSHIFSFLACSKHALATSDIRKSEWPAAFEVSSKQERTLLINEA